MPEEPDNHRTSSAIGPAVSGLVYPPCVMDMHRTLARSKHGHSPFNRTLGEGRETDIEQGALGALGFKIQDKTIKP